MHAQQMTATAGGVSSSRMGRCSRSSKQEAWSSSRTMRLSTTAPGCSQQQQQQQQQMLVHQQANLRHRSGNGSGTCIGRQLPPHLPSQAGLSSTLQQRLSLTAGLLSRVQLWQTGGACWRLWRMVGTLGHRPLVLSLRCGRVRGQREGTGAGSRSSSSRSEERTVRVRTGIGGSRGKGGEGAEQQGSYWHDEQQHQSQQDDEQQLEQETALPEKQTVPSSQ